MSLFVVLTATLLIILYTLINGISPVPSSGLVRKEILKLINNRCSGCKSAIEAGAGWGTLLFPASKTLPHCSFMAFENSPIPYLFITIKKAYLKSRNIEVSRVNFYKASFNGADLVLCYLFPGGMEKLKPLLEKELAPGAIVISNTFAVKGWKPEYVIRVNDIYRTPVYFYRVPAAN